MVYRADDAVSNAASDAAFEFPDVDWRPSIHMPRWASRLTLRIKSVRVERLQEITVADVIREGIDLEGEHADWFAEGERLQSAGAPMSGERYAFMRLWDSINGTGSWDANPWVWVVEFERMENWNV